MPDHAPGLGEETISANEPEVIARIVAMNLDTLDKDARPMPRGQHPKSHGTVAGTFEVLPTLEPPLVCGVFQPGASYDALVRFSNGLWDDDTKEDAHGMAIKLLDVPGPKLQPGLPDSTTHDFILIDSPVFFSDTLDDYEVVNENLGAILEAIRNEDNPIFRLAKILVNAVELVIEDFKTFKRIKAFASKTPASPLASNYWSSVPFLMGNGRAVKYAAYTPGAEAPGAQGGVSGPNALATALTQDLSNGPVVYLFGVHIQTDAVLQPVEDATVSWWPESDPNGKDTFVPLATLTLTHLEDADKDQLAAAENRVFSPWNVLAEHRPLGVINRIRRTVYSEMATARNKANDVSSAGSTNR